MATNLIRLLCNFEHKTSLSESKVLCWYVAVQEDVDTFPHSNGHRDNAIDSRHSIQTADEVREVVQNAQVMLHHNHIPRESGRRGGEEGGKEGGEKGGKEGGEEGGEEGGGKDTPSVN